MTSKELIFLLENVGSKIYKKPLVKSPSLNELNIGKILDLALKNNVAYYTARKLLELKSMHVLDFQAGDEGFVRRICDVGDTIMRMQRNSLELIDAHLNDYVIIKHYKAYPRIPDDVDVLVKDFDESIRSLEKGGMRIQPQYHFPKLGETMLRKKQCTQVHLHKRISWYASEYMDKELPFEKSRRVILDGVNMEINIPSVEVEFLTHIAHINFENLYINVPDLFYLFKLMSEANWDIMLQQASKHGWKYAFRRTVNIIIKLNYILYSKENDNVEKTDLTLPVELPRTHMVASFIEKRALGHAIASISMALVILFTGQTYANVKVPTEVQIFAPTRRGVIDPQLLPYSSRRK